MTTYFVLITAMRIELIFSDRKSNVLTVRRSRHNTHVYYLSVVIQCVGYGAKTFSHNCTSPLIVKDKPITFSLKVDCKETKHNACIMPTKKQSNSFILVRTPRNDLKPFTKRIAYSYAVQLTLTKLSAYGASSSPISSFITRYDLQRELYKRLYRYSLFINHKWYYS